MGVSVGGVGRVTGISPADELVDSGVVGDVGALGTVIGGRDVVTSGSLAQAESAISPIRTVAAQRKGALDHHRIGFLLSLVSPGSALAPSRPWTASARTGIDTPPDSRPAGVSRTFVF
jgi:hypothetical protein